MRAFWLFSQNVGTGDDSDPVRPDLDGINGRWTCPGDILRMTGPVASPHVHLLVGGVALPDDNLDGLTGSRHFHYLVYNGTSWYQTTVDNVGSTPAHTHTYSIAANNRPIPDYLLTFWGGSNSQADALLDRPGNIHIVEAVLSGNQVASLDNTPWTAPQRTAWYNQILNILGIKLPTEVDRGKRVVMLFLGALNSRVADDDRNYRFDLI